MKLVVHELTASGVSQELRPEKNMILAAVRPHIYRHSTPSGQLSLQVFDESDVMVAESESVNIADIGSAPFFHGYVTFAINGGLKKDHKYTFRLVGSGYSFSESSYVGWCSGFDLGKYPSTYTVDDMIKVPLDIEIWERTP